MADIKKGTHIGPYVIIEVLPGVRGGMAEVYRASDARMQSEVVLKISRNDYDDPRFGNALKNEVDILKALRHPGVVRVLSLPLASAKQEVFMARALELQGRPWFYAMEYLPGGSLKEFIDHLGALPFPLACGIATRMIDTLIFIHSRNIAHLDVKPENILFRYTPQRGTPIEPVLIDFGVAARSKECKPQGGSLHTMAPEHLRQMRGELPPETPLDVTKMDTYSLGVATYRMWTGDYPFGGITSRSLSSAVLNAAVKPPSQVNPKLSREADELMLRWLAKDPYLRPSLEELKHYLYYWSEGASYFVDLPDGKHGKKGRLFGKR